MRFGKGMIDALVGTAIDIVSDMVPRKTFLERVEEMNTEKKTFFRVHGSSPVYVYGKRPGEPLLKHAFHPEGISCPRCEPELDVDIIRGHFAKCSQEKGSCGGLCELCKKLNNPKRMEFLVRLYNDGRPLDQAGFNVGTAEDKSELNLSATSVYLKQLAMLGLIRRERNGRIVNYVPEVCSASSCVREIAEMMRARWRANPTDTSFVPIFRVMMGPFRAKVVRQIAAVGPRTVEDLAAQFDKKTADLIRELEWAVKGGLLELDSQDSEGTYRYVVPADQIARRIVELS